MGDLDDATDIEIPQYVQARHVIINMQTWCICRECKPDVMRQYKRQRRMRRKQRRGWA